LSMVGPRFDGRGESYKHTWSVVLAVEDDSQDAHVEQVETVVVVVRARSVELERYPRCIPEVEAFEAIAAHELSLDDKAFRPTNRLSSD